MRGNIIRLCCIKACSIILVICFLLILHSCGSQKDYKKILCDKLNVEREFSVSEVFDFPFDCAYVMDDPYTTGEYFAAEYGLDISISEVTDGWSFDTQRIVFVDSDGDFIYQFTFSMSEVGFCNDTIAIYPETLIKKCGSNDGYDFIFSGKVKELQK